MTTASARVERWLAPGPTAYVVLGGVVAALATPLIWTLVGLSLGLAVILIGFVLLAVLLLVSDGLSRFHRARAAALLHATISTPARPSGPGVRHLLARLGQPTTWRQLAYHALVGPTLLVASAAVVSLAWGTGVMLLLAPVLSLGIPADAAGARRIDTPLVSAASILAGLIVLWASPQIARGLARLDLAILRPMLGATRGEQLSPRVTALEQTRAGVIDAADAERRRIERDLHDGAQQRLTSLALNLGMARSGLREDAPPEARRAIEEAHDEAKEALAELRAFVRGLHPAVLDERGLDAALSGIVARSPVPTTLRVRMGQRPTRTIEAVAYFVVSEALTNVAKHSGARSATVQVTSDAHHVVVEVSDDGRGGATLGSGSGLVGLSSRVAAVDGRLTVTSPAGGPTVLRAELPCAS